MRLLAPPLVPEQAAARVAWFIRLRWLAAAGVAVFAAAGRFPLRLRFPIAPFLLIAVGVALYNTVFLLIGRKMARTGAWSGGFATVQVVADILALTVLMHFGGGIENPLIPYYLFHIIIAAILLSWWQVVLQALFASACLAALAAAELSGLIPHRHVDGLLPVELYTDWKFVTVGLLAFVTTLLITAFLAASVAERLHQRERQLTQANAVLAEQDRIKSQYVMRVAHDLAGPTGMITSCLKVVTQGLAGPIPERALDMVQRAEGKSEYVGHLIRDLLSLSRIKAAKEVPKTSVDLARVVEKVFEEAQPRATAKDLALNRQLPESLPAVHGNREAIHELLSNLVINAVKYTLVGGRVEVAAFAADREVVVKVRDNGVGIPAEAIPHIFEEFYRADNVRAEAVEGTGLGLSIVRRILDAHGGRIWVKSQQGKGTTFSFTLPVTEGADA